MAVHRNPLVNFRFRVNWNGIRVAGFSGVSGLRQSTEVFRYREGGDNTATRKIMGQTDYAPITLERGLATDYEFYLWAAAVYNPLANIVPDQLVRHIITIDLLDKLMKPARTWLVFNAFPSDYETTDFSATNSSIVMERLTLEHEGIVQFPPGTFSFVPD